MCIIYFDPIEWMMMPGWPEVLEEPQVLQEAQQAHKERRRQAGRRTSLQINVSFQRAHT